MCFEMLINTHKFGLYWHTHGFHAAKKNFLNILSYRPIEDKLFLMTACRDQHNHLKINSLTLEGIRHIQKDATNRNTVHGYHLKVKENKIKFFNILFYLTKQKFVLQYFYCIMMRLLG